MLTTDNRGGESLARQKPSRICVATGIRVSNYIQTLNNFCWVYNIIKLDKNNFANLP